MPFEPIFLPQATGWAGSWLIREPLSVLMSQVGEADRSEAAQITHPLRLRQWWAGRLLVQTLLAQAALPACPVHKDAAGRPVLAGVGLDLSITHAGDQVVAAITPLRIGIDLETVRPALRIVAPRILHPEEWHEAGGDLDKLTLYWAAKEALYKWLGQKGVDFRREIQVEPPTTDRPFGGHICGHAVRLQAIAHPQPWLVIASNGPEIV